MQLPKISAPLLLSGLALAVSVSGVGAAAAGLINGASIKPGTITGRQIKNRSVPVVKLSGAVPTAFPTRLPAGASLRGNYWVGGTATSALNGAVFESTISWFWPTRSLVTVQRVPPSAPSTRQCPGTRLTPRAARGYLCLYAQVTAVPVGGVTTNVSPSGVLLTVVDPTPPGLYFDLGTWAVTGN